MDKVKVLLLAVYNNQMNEILEEIGIGSIAAYLRENGYEVMLMGANVSRINYEKIVDFAPDIVGLPTYTVSKKSVYSVCKRIREWVPKVHICLGGLFPTYYHREILRENPDIDFIARGEGELVLLGLAECLNEGSSLSDVKGLTYRQGAEICVNEDQEIVKDMDKMPFPHKDIVVDNKLKHVLISTSRGCTSNCSFCVSRNFWGKWRGRSSKSIINEIKHIVENYSIYSFDFVDSSFEDPDPNCNRMIDIAKEIIKENLNISYYAQMRSDFCRKATPAIMDILKKSGLCGVFLGVEAANETDRKIYNKIATVEDNYKAIELFEKYDIGVSIGFINFNPYSTFESLHSNIQFLEKHNYARFFDKVESRFIIYNNKTRLYERLVRDNLIKERDDPFCFDYEFVDERIKKLSDFLADYFERMREDSDNYYGKLNNYNYMHMNAIQQFTRLFTSLKDNSAYRVVKEHEVKVKNILSDLNRVNSDWFKKLLHLAENGWDEWTALEIMDRALNKSYLSNTLSSLNNEKHSLYKNLLEIKSEYIKYF
ncbi:B12-binding domain-containing radical SAM protein [Wukongibacter sp. M2B1]|uniref:B12-binding domain-containing radical SAM protein n=1 Tax=Wukongibacter sp. M2B1 TaxID=3088895 RepID=UPI003D7B0944